MDGRMSGGVNVEWNVTGSSVSPITMSCYWPQRVRTCCRVRDLLPHFVGEGWHAADIDRLILSLIGQCLIYRHARPMVERLCPGTMASPDAIDRTAEVIFQFSLAALRQLGHEKGQKA